MNGIKPSRDIRDRADIDELVREFYGAAFGDEIIGYIFTDIARLDLGKHLPIIADFWEMMLLGGESFPAKYGRSPMSAHIDLNEREQLRSEHFDRWLKLFGETVDRLFHGPVAELAKVRAAGIAETMRLRVSGEIREGVRIRRG
jgi:hemoglobin